MMTQRDNISKANRKTLRNLVIVAFLMFGFGYALVPLYDLFCELTGIRPDSDRMRTSAKAAEIVKVDKSRWVTVEFTGQTMSGLPWEFRPMVNKIRVHPGQATVVNFFVRNTSNDVIVGQAIPNIVPPKATRYFKKIECFCFSKQTLRPGETRLMPVQFVIDSKLDKRIDTLTLSYHFFNTDKKSVKKYLKDNNKMGHGSEPIRHAHQPGTEQL